MARIAGVDLPRNKRIEIALTYIYGIGRHAREDPAQTADVSPDKRTDDLDENEIRRIRDVDRGTSYKVEGDLRREVPMNIKRLMDLGCYRGLRHRKSLPVRGQRTHTNARTRKGPRKGQCIARRRDHGDGRVSHGRRSSRWRRQAPKAKPKKKVKKNIQSGIAHIQRRSTTRSSPSPTSSGNVVAWSSAGVRASRARASRRRSPRSSPPRTPRHKAMEHGMRSRRPCS